MTIQMSNSLDRPITDAEILIVDDDPACEVVRYALSQAGFRARGAGNGRGPPGHRRAPARSCCARRRDAQLDGVESVAELADIFRQSCFW